MEGIARGMGFSSVDELYSWIAVFEGDGPDSVEIPGPAREAVARLEQSKSNERLNVRRIPFFDVKIPAGGWVESGEGRTADEAAGYGLVDDQVPRDAFALRIKGDSMTPDYPSGSVVVFAPVRPGERDSKPFEPGKAYYFEHSDGKATFKAVYYEPPKERYRLEPINPKYRAMFVPEQMLARMSRAIRVIRYVD
jgi:SOS-response transcriptional repressor LexA